MVLARNDELADAVEFWLNNTRERNASPKEEVYRFQAVVNGIAAVIAPHLLHACWLRFH